MIKQKLKSKELGNCIKIACEFVIDNPNFLFCHAYVIGAGVLEGQRILHAWNEFGDVVFDKSNGHDVTTRKEHYYRVAQIEEKDVTRLDKETVCKLMLETETYGGWIK